MIAHQRSPIMAMLSDREDDKHWRKACDRA